jgi:Cdc6-like AAA superfamily ATPase
VRAWLSAMLVMVVCIFPPALCNHRQSVLYNLLDWPTREHSRLVVIGIANTMDLPERLLPRVHSRLGMGRLAFAPYSKEDIIAIVKERLSGLAAFDPDSINMAGTCSTRDPTHRCTWLTLCTSVARHRLLRR